MLKVKLLHPHAIAPTVAHPGEDLGYDLYALTGTVLPYGVATAVPTGIAARFEIQQDDYAPKRNFGLLIRDRSSMAIKGIKTSAGVVDAGYTGELKVIMTCATGWHVFSNASRFLPKGYQIKTGDKIAQMIPTEVFTSGDILIVDDLEETQRGSGGFGSTGS